MSKALLELIEVYRLKQLATLQPTQDLVEQIKELKNQESGLYKRLEKLEEQWNTLSLRIGQDICAEIEKVCYWQEIPSHFSGIYFIFDEDFKILYIGQSQNVKQRLAGDAHKVMKMKFRERYLTGLISIPALEYRLKREAELIKLFNPVENTNYTSA